MIKKVTYTYLLLFVILTLISCANHRGSEYNIPPRKVITKDIPNPSMLAISDDPLRSIENSINSEFNPLSPNYDPTLKEFKDLNKDIFSSIKIILSDYYRPLPIDEILRYAIAGIYRTVNESRLDELKNRLSRAIVLKSAWEAYAKEFLAAYKYVNSSASSPSSDTIFYTVNEEITSHLDRLSRFITSEEYAEYTYTGYRESIGVEIALRDKKIIIVRPLPNSPAEKAGLVKGDEILEIDGRATSDKFLIQVVNMIRGPSHSVASLLISRNGNKQVYKITRELIHDTPIAIKQLDGNFVYLDIVRMNQSVNTVIDEWFSGKDNIQGLILDLRANPGGPLNEVVDLADKFIHKGIILSTRNHKKNSLVSYESTDQIVEALRNVDIVVLVDKYCGSGVTILAEALRKYRNAIIVGTSTIRNSTIQTIFPLPKSTAIKLTTSEIIFADNRKGFNYQLIPDYCVTMNNQPMQIKFKKMAYCPALTLAKDKFQQELIQFSVKLITQNKARNIR